MSVMHFFFPEQASAGHLGAIASSLARANRIGRTKDRRQNAAISDVEEDLGSLALILMTLIATLVKNGVVTREELAGHLGQIDTMDGDADGRLSLAALRAALGFGEPEKPEPEAPTPTPKPRSRRRR